MPSATVTLIGRSGCHLCDDARLVIERVVAEVNADAAHVTVAELSIDDDKALFDRYWDQIPVVLIDGKVHNFWRVDEVRLRRALTEKFSGLDDMSNSAAGEEHA